MSKLNKILLILASTLVGLFLIVVVIIKIAISETVIKEKVLPVLQTQLHRNVSVEHASVQILPTIGIILENLEVSDDSLFSKSPFLKLEKFTLGIRLFPLITGNIVVNEIGVSGLSVRVIKNENGIFNFASMTESSTEKKTDETTDETSADSKIDNNITLDNFHIDQSNIYYDDLSSHQSVKLENLNYKLKVSIGSAPWNLQHQLSIEHISLTNSLGALLKNVPLSLSQDLDYYYDDDHLSIKQTDFQFSNVKLDMKGDVKSVRDSVKQIQLVIESGDVDLQQFLHLVPSSIVKQVSEIQTRGTFSFTANVIGNFSSTEIPAVDYSFNMKNGYFKYSSLPAALSDLSVSLKGTDHSVDIDHISGSIKNSTFNISAKVNNFKDPEVDIKSDIKISLDDVKDFYPMDENQSVSGSVNAQVSVSGKALNTKSLKGNGKIVFDKLSLKDKNLPKGIQEINGTFIINNDFASLEKLKLVVGSSDIELTGKVSNYLGLVLNPDSVKLVPQFTSSLISNRLDVSDFVDLKKEKAEDVKPEQQSAASLPVLPNIEGKFNASIKKFIYDDITASNTSATIEVKNQSISFSNTKTEVFGGSIGLDGGLKFKAEDQSTYQFKMNASKLKSSDFLSLVPSVEKYTQMAKYLKGDISVDGNFNGILSDTLSPKLESITAAGAIGIANANLSDHPIQVNMGKYLGLTEFNNLSFDDWNMGTEIKDGKLYVKNLKASSKKVGLDIEANGWQSLDQQIDYDVTLHLPKWMSDKMSTSEYGKLAASYVTDNTGKIVVDLKVTGKFDEPKVAPDPKKSAGRVADQVLDKVKDEASKKIEEEKVKLKTEADKTLEDAKKKAEAEAKKKAEEEAKKKLKKLFGN